MKEFPTWHEYLKTHGSKDMKADDQKQLHSTYKKAYLSEYNKRRKTKQLTITTNLKEYRFFQKHHKRYTQHSFNKFILDCAKAYLNQDYVDPDPAGRNNLNQSINKIGNVINQVVHKLHIYTLRMNQSGRIEPHLESMYRMLEGFEKLKSEVNKLKERIAIHTAKIPETVVNLSWQEIQHDTQKLDILINALLAQRELITKI